MHQNNLKYGKWLQKIVWNKERRNPIVMLYTDNFMLDIAASSQGSHPIVLGIDTTFEVTIKASFCLDKKSHTLSGAGFKLYNFYFSLIQLSSCFATILTYRYLLYLLTVECIVHVQSLLLYISLICLPTLPLENMN